ncbi:AI-2E family transporter [Chitinimonas sp. BJYL2]|uniref:AI-2E family transporter n=1 Tax=Chitinimonas sp. BJYL2 TaxID=2976696 RepID=UPI0022B39921|nr:AI-2E family transporter [Chitinimonas sp. BJYL2]
MRPARRSRSLLARYAPVAIAAVVAVVLYLLAPVLAPFLTAGVLAYILAPLVDRLSGRGISRALAVSMVMVVGLLLLVALVLVIVPLFVRQLSELYGYLPQALVWARETLAPWLQQRLGVDAALDLDSIKAWLAAHTSEAGQLLRAMLPSITTGSLALVGLFANLVLIPVVLFYFLRDWPQLLRDADDLLPRRWHAKFHELAGEVDAVLGEFLRGQVAVMLIMSMFYSAALWLAGLQSALPIGVIAGLLVFVPYLGLIVGALLATLAAALQFQSLLGLVPVWGVFLLGQLIEGFVVTPKLVGERIGLHPVAVIFALMAFGQLFGFVGILLALPLAAVLLVGLRHVRSYYMASTLYRK